MNIFKKTFPEIPLMLLFIAVTFMYLSVGAQTPSPPQQGVLAIKAAQIHTFDKGTIENGVILIRDGIIEAVGTDIDIPEGATMMVYDEKQVYPAFIHARTLLGITEIGRVAETTDFNELGSINPNVRADVAFHPGSTHIGLAAANGIALAVTTPSGGLISGLSAALYTDGWNHDDLAVVAPLGLVVNWPGMLNNSNLKEQLAEIQEAFDKGRRYHRAVRSGSDYVKDIRWEAMLEVFDKDLPVFIHANELSQIQAAVSWAMHEDIKFVITGGRDAAYLAEQLAAQQIPVLLTPIISGPARQWEYYGASYKRASQLYKAGVKFAITGDFGAASAYRLPFHASAAAAFGLPHEEAFKAITLYTAEIMGLDHLAGNISEGKHAHLIITDGHPLEFSTHIEQVFVKGKKIDMKNKHIQLKEKYLEKQNQHSPK